MNATTNHYEVLEVSPTATQSEIKQAYKRKLRLVHPDVLRGYGDTSEFIALNNAYAVLSDVDLRIQFDRELLSSAEFEQRLRAADRPQNKVRRVLSAGLLAILALLLLQFCAPVAREWLGSIPGFVGERGQTGLPGPAGQDGADGRPGLNGRDGRNAVSGVWGQGVVTATSCDSSLRLSISTDYRDLDFHLDRIAVSDIGQACSGQTLTIFLTLSQSTSDVYQAGDIVVCSKALSADLQAGSASAFTGTDVCVIKGRDARITLDTVLARDISDDIGGIGIEMSA